MDFGEIDYSLLNSTLFDSTKRELAEVGTFLIAGFTKEDAGNYTCTVRNHFDRTGVFSVQSDEIILEYKGDRNCSSYS